MEGECRPPAAARWYLLGTYGCKAMLQPACLNLVPMRCPRLDALLDLLGGTREEAHELRPVECDVEAYIAADQLGSPMRIPCR